MAAVDESAVFPRSKSYLYLATEDVWGSNPVGTGNSGSDASGSAQDSVLVPVDTYDVRFRPENRQARPYLGLLQRKHNKNYRGMPSGNLTTGLFGYRYPDLGESVAEFMMDWAFSSPEAKNRPSKTAEWAEGPNIANKVHNGLRVNSATLSGDSDSDRIALSLELMGKTEDELPTAKAIAQDVEELSDFCFADATFQLDGATVNLSGFSFSRSYSLVTSYLNSTTPSVLVATDCLETLSLTPLKQDDAWDIVRRNLGTSDHTARITLKGLHNGSGSSGDYTQVQIDFDRISFVDADEGGGLADLASHTLNFAVLKPDTSNAAARFTWSEV